jgi:monoamine oxidase
MQRESDDCDAIVIGAGAAGLAAAIELVCKGRHVCILEAREWPGGRILTLEDGAPVPIELGAEFIHGESPCVFEHLARTGDAAIDVPRARWTLQRRELRRAEPSMASMQRQLQALRKPSRDISFADLLRRHRRALTASARSLACTLVEGFDAADPERVSALETLAEWSGAAAADAPTFRPRRGFGPLIGSMVEELKAHGAGIRFGAVVSEVRWRRARVEVHFVRHGEPEQMSARFAIIALPLGVLQLPPQVTGAVRFVPEPRGYRAALDRLNSGPVTKLVMRFEQPFWEEIEHERYRDAAFFHAPQAPFPTFWTTLPVRTPLLTAWSGGPRAARLEGKSDGELVQLALQSLEALFGRAPYARMLQSVRCHDWQRDPFAIGAYSSAGVGGGTARRALARPVQDTLFFAGEALDEDESGSVGGAINTGTLAARRSLHAR